MPDLTDRLEELKRQIEELRSELHRLIDASPTLRRDRIIELSQELDRALVEYQKLRSPK